MIERVVKIKLETGLQSRPAAHFVQEANRYTAHLFLEKDGKRINAKSIMGLMSLAVGSGETVTLIADGTDEEIALNELETLVSNKYK
ncbi:HPr family phosphocarrier protein [Virgibacillus necropolis]|uniref:Phosphocarrier protein Chr n=1 Tax=Virgibacillus necropolis TaxID=163877 RepID=A0A221MAU5_9BACI|nr:HPr family phosphocarrier protein [Virgibacillus necropolis]ASN04761.1 phosphocarrier protein Chr [Virgibacillus necropolis]